MSGYSSVATAPHYYVVRKKNSELDFDFIRNAKDIWGFNADNIGYPQET